MKMFPRPITIRCPASSPPTQICHLHIPKLAHHSFLTLTIHTSSPTYHHLSAMLRNLLRASTLEEDTFFTAANVCWTIPFIFKYMRLDDSKHLHNNVVWYSTNITWSLSHQLKNQVVSYKYFMHVCGTLVNKPIDHLTLPVTYQHIYLTYLCLISYHNLCKCKDVPIQALKA